MKISKAVLHHLTTKPFSSQIIVSNLTADEIEFKLWKAVKPEHMQMHKQLQQQFVFTGIVQKYFFKMVRKKRYTQKFSPLMIGQVEETANGSIIFLKYFMSPNATFMMFYFFISTSLIGLFLFDYESVLYSFAIPTLMFGLSYIGAILVFNYQLSKCGSMIQKLLSSKADQDFE
jgi:hypothetical protein